jgi:hypothetical protein
MLAASCGGDPPATQAGARVDGDSGRYAAIPTPGGLRLCGAADAVSAAGFPDPPAETTTVWGDASLKDPWRGPLAVVTQKAGDELYQHEGARPVRVGGHDADVAPMPLFQAVSSADWGHVVTWHTSPTRVVEVARKGASADEAVRLAGRREVDGAPARLPSVALGKETRVIHADDPPPKRFGWLVQYTTGKGLIVVAGDPASPDDLELARLYAVESQPATVNGRPGVRLARFDRDRGPFEVAWHTPDGQLVSVAGIGTTQDEVDATLAAVHELTGDEWSALLAEPTSDCLPTPPG